MSSYGASSYGAEEHVFEYYALKHLFESSNNALLVSVGYVQLTESQIELQTSWTIKKKKSRGYPECNAASTKLNFMAI